MANKTAFTGLQDIYYAILTKDDETGVTYGVPKRLAPAINISVSQNEETSTLDADNKPIIVETSKGDTEVELTVSDIPQDVLAEILGKTVNEAGVMIDSDKDITPYIALGFRRTRNDNSSRLTWMLKGKFMSPTEEGQTKASTGATEYQTPTISAVFVKRIFDENRKFSIETAAEGADPAVIAAWFNQVYDPTATVPNG